MAILIGVDEAGYGPNYGPLVVAASAWRVNDDGVGRQGPGSGNRRTASASPGKRAGSSATPAAAAIRAASPPDLYALLAGAVVRSPAECARRLAIADSKALYKSGSSVRQLERGVLAALGALQHDVATVLDLVTSMEADRQNRRWELACHCGDDIPLPVGLAAGEARDGAADLLVETCRGRGVALLTLQARLVYPAEFNELCDAFGTKGAALSHVTLALVRELVESMAGGAQPSAAGESIVIFLDKHGGRNCYAGLVQHHFPESWIDTIFESRAESRYRWVHGGTSIEAAFRVGCEKFLPTALASMAAKYHRELAMRAFNAYWAVRVPGLRPTAGYPADARRFRAEISTVQAALGIADRMLWRSR